MTYHSTELCVPLVSLGYTRNNPLGEEHASIKLKLNPGLLFPQRVV